MSEKQIRGPFPKAAPAAIVDTHCHLALPEFAEDRPEALHRARRAGVRWFVHAGTNHKDSAQAIALAGEHTDVKVAVGFHPRWIDHRPPDWKPRLERMTTHPAVVAVGEIGLDYYRRADNKPAQKEAFRSQLDFAAARGLPVIIHCRDAWEDVMAVLCRWQESSGFRDSPLAQRPVRGVLHAFSGQPSHVRTAGNLGFMLGLGGPVTFRNARDLHALVPNLPLDRLLLETDCPYLAPHPHRGRRNEPALLPLVCARIAELCGRTAMEVANITTANALRCFGLPQAVPAT
ncbi:MAG: TatD family hydrolase [Caldilineaceae bacterium]|nr:TatD family hydrolase [Caldilineaceae bacterium]